uniref:DOT1 domain-containing protein n=1 Tax=Chromera velia CCMP2878 TaxID=1169474 RepID=A0A0G4HNN7_9ALVE|mmetsp:Transcript_24101/g.47306  ORF Transcript_24101/g.47306 Transcript_24101/m.47306 type:complete len:500 (+) Transcript_24101:333-1832(+)|eukprot:Cvel_7673.t1-p1 / transcript=Cvel_7673.t1 / gene=Cvel_7673 / organism=Chromera_velia_CCMP2878 / gene_product=hypothetical protein / transcript_product=hypothetical protein / location=Cvel_scaffold407:47689-51636(+) / protein_length=499 / sequence_SO=supercontig / SO=protein_coding / is_pseudo=false
MSRPAFPLYVCLCLGWLRSSVEAAGINPAVFEPRYCKIMETLEGAVSAHTQAWNETSVQVTAGTCENILEYLYVSRADLKEQAEYIQTNVTSVILSRPDSSTQTMDFLNLFTHLGSMLSAHLHLNTLIVARRPECFASDFRFLMAAGLARLKDLNTQSLYVAWAVAEGNNLKFNSLVQKWLSKYVETLRQETEVLKDFAQNYTLPEIHMTLPTIVESHGALSSVEALKRVVFSDPQAQMETLDRGLVRFLLTRLFGEGDSVAEFGAGSGRLAATLDQTGIVEASAFDGAAEIDVITGGKVRHARLDLPLPSRPPNGQTGRPGGGQKDHDGAEEGEAEGEKGEARPWADWVVALKVFDLMPVQSHQTVGGNLGRAAGVGVVMSRPMSLSLSGGWRGAGGPSFLPLSASGGSSAFSSPLLLPEQQQGEGETDTEAETEAADVQMVRLMQAVSAGFKFDEGSTRALREVVSSKALKKTLMVFRKEGVDHDQGHAKSHEAGES